MTLAYYGLPLLLFTAGFAAGLTIGFSIAKRKASS